MARGTQSSNKTYFKIAYEGNDKDNGQPFFSEQKKEGDNWVGISKDTFLEGKIIGISQGSYEYKNKPQYTFEIIIDGGDENYALQLNFGYFTRSILNSLAPITDLNGTKLRLEIWRNKDGYVTVAVKNSTVNPDGEKTEWLMDHKKLPKLDEPKWLESFTYFINVITANLPTGEAAGLGVVKMDGDNTEMIAETLEMTEEDKTIEGMTEGAPTTEKKIAQNGEEVDDLPF
jgi:hypothetical protein